MTTMRRLKCLVYRIGKCLGLFALARRVTRRQVRILCYHGYAIGDEYRFRPGMFIRPETARARFEILARKHYPVISLDRACRGLQDGNLPDCPVVITYDDGFYSNYVHGVLLHRETGFPATIYVTTYYVLKELPIFRLVVKYMFWKTDRTELDLDGLAGTDRGTLSLVAERDEVERVIRRLLHHAETCLGESERVTLARELGTRLGIDYEELLQSRRLSLMTPDEIRSLGEAGLDVQLHTHRHHFPCDEEQVHREIEDNRAILEAIVGRRCEHFCYPDGIFSPEQWPWLKARGIKSATTVERGLNTSRTSRYGLRRFIDAETVLPIEFEAEVSGFAEMIRPLLCLLGLGPRPADEPVEYGDQHESEPVPVGQPREFMRPVASSIAT